MEPLHTLITPERFDAVLFDLDGVLTSTASMHAACWKQTFDEFLSRRAQAEGQPFHPFEIATDYKDYVDGKPRYDGVRSFLASRNIVLPEGSPASPPAEISVGGIGNRKNELVQAALAAGGIEAFPGSVALVRHLRGLGIRTAVVSSSKNCPAVLQAAGIADLFETVVDGKTAAEQRLPGKPAPDTFLHAARLVGAAAPRAVVVEDAQAGVAAGKAGGFGLVIGVARHDDADALRQHGADVVVADLGEFLK